MKRLALLASLVGLLLGGWATPAEAAWCGTTATADRPQLVAGPFVHLVYAYPSDGADRSSTVAQTIESDVREIDGWWRGQDPTRTPRFDLFPFPCGVQPDISVVRLVQNGAELAPVDGGWEKILVGTAAAGFGSFYGRYVIYYDGPVADANLCGAAGGFPDRGPGFAVIYVNACSGVPLAPTAAHELLHALGALPDGARQTCEGDPGHPCDSEQDILYPFVTGMPFAQQVLDVGHDDYYGHSSPWFDIQDSAWLRKLDAQVMLNETVTGGGKVVSTQPGPECAATCAIEWDRGSAVTLEAVAPPGKRFVRWTGACTGVLPCNLKLDASTSVSAVFAPARFRLSVAVTGKGLVRSVPAGLACRVRCAASFTSFQALRLRATPNKGWRFARWTGACTGTGACVVPMTKAAAVRAVFARRR